MGALEAIGRVVVTVLLAGGIGLIVRTLVSRMVGEKRIRLADAVGAIVGLYMIFYLLGDRTTRFLDSGEAAKAASTLWGVVLGVSVSAALFVGANVLFNQASKNYTMFKTALGALFGFVTFGLLDGNRLIQWVQGRESVADGLHDVVNANSFTLFLFSSLIMAAIASAYGFAYGITKDEPVRFMSIAAGVGAGLGALWGLFFAERIPVDTAINVIWTPLLGALLGGALGYVLSRLDQPLRLAVGAAGGAGLGALIGGLMFQAVSPRLEVTSFIVWTVLVAAIGAGIARLRGTSVVNGALTGATIGWVIGAFVVTGTGGPRMEAIGACVVTGALAGGRFGSSPLPSDVQRTDIENRSRGPIFLAPAAFFIGAGLIIPLIRTIYLSFTESVRREGIRGRFTEYAGLKNYREIFLENPTSFDVGEWDTMFTSAPFQLGLLFVVAALAIGVSVGRRSGNSVGGSNWLVPFLGILALITAFFELRFITSDGTESAQSDVVEAASTPIWRYGYLILFALAGVALLYAAVTRRGAAATTGTGHQFDLAGGQGGVFALGLFLVVTGVFASLRGTIFNSLWWVFTVTVLSTVMGLAVAALADRAKMENVAKSIIFMPLAISFVGAGIIWRFMFIARPEGRPQTGVLNWTWLKIGDLANSDWKWLGVLVLLALVAAALSMSWVGYKKNASGLIGTGIGLALPLLWLTWRLADGRLGGVGERVLDRTLFFISDDLPYNNLWLMVVLIWIQTGFAMVIFSAAIKAVPSEFIEAAKVDGATDASIFWRIIVPSILPTIGVVTTTLIVTVLKVFDIVRVMTNGNFETQVIANEMFVQAFSNRNVGLGSALAVVLFVSVVPVVFVNVRRLQHEEG
ncbi:MAG: sugar ABC transporter permease [Acidimicrobiales bacterium]|nr:sugar ABC transporter permease [Acidimicrobiales bacterium]